jgi:hypothetical protein
MNNFELTRYRDPDLLRDRSLSHLGWNTPPIIERRDALAVLAESDPRLMRSVIREMGLVAVRQTAASKLLDSVHTGIQNGAASLAEAVRQKGHGRLHMEGTQEVPGTGGLFSSPETVSVSFTITVD